MNTISSLPVTAIVSPAERDPKVFDFCDGCIGHNNKPVCLALPDCGSSGPAGKALGGKEAIWIISEAA